MSNKYYLLTYLRSCRICGVSVQTIQVDVVAVRAQSDKCTDGACVEPSSVDLGPVVRLE